MSKKVPIAPNFSPKRAHFFPKAPVFDPFLSRFFDPLAQMIDQNLHFYPKNTP
jgi:hypothetical protein